LLFLFKSTSLYTKVRIPSNQTKRAQQSYNTEDDRQRAELDNSRLMDRNNVISDRSSTSCRNDHRYTAAAAAAARRHRRQ